MQAFRTVEIPDSGSIAHIVVSQGRATGPMVKARKQTKVVTDLAPSSPADVPLVPAAAEETVPENVPETVPGSPSSSEQPDNSRPVRVYADGTVTEFADKRLHISSS